MADNAQSTFIRVGPNGEITYDFEGHISAQGINLPQSSSGLIPEEAEPDSVVGWYDVNNKIKSFIYGYANSHLVLYGGNSSALPGTARLDIHSATNNLDHAYLRAFLSNLPTEILIYDDQERSKFYQAVNNLRHVQNSGLVEIEFPGGTPKSNVVTISHGLGETPSDIQLTASRTEAAEALAEPVIIDGSLTSTTFKVRLLGSVAFAAGSKIKVYWQAST